MSLPHRWGGMKLGEPTWGPLVCLGKHGASSYRLPGVTSENGSLVMWHRYPHKIMPIKKFKSFCLPRVCSSKKPPSIWRMCEPWQRRQLLNTGSWWPSSLQFKTNQPSKWLTDQPADQPTDQPTNKQTWEPGSQFCTGASHANCTQGGACAELPAFALFWGWASP